MVLVLFPFAEVLFSGSICVYLCAGHVHTQMCLCAYWEYTGNLDAAWTW